MRTIPVEIRDGDTRDAMLRLGTDEEQERDALVVEDCLATTESAHGRDILHRFEEQVTLCRKWTNVDEQTQKKMQTVYVARARAMRDELRSECITVSEQLLADEVVSAWCRLQIATIRSDAANTWDEVSFYGKQVDRAQRRYLRAVETLSRVRRYEVVMTERREPDGTQEQSVVVKGSA
jgi:hypothetical protein